LPALACPRGELRERDDAVRIPTEIVYDRLADFGSPRSAAPTQIGGEALTAR
jgi:hypothetical protein